MTSRRYLLCLILAAITAGCAGGGNTPEVRRYVLTEPPLSTSPPSDTASLPTVGISPIRMAAFIDTTAMVTMNTDGTALNSAYHRWAEPPRAAVAQMLVTKLPTLTDGYRFESALTGIASEWVFRIDIYLERFNAVATGEVSMAGHWRLIRSEDNHLVTEAPFGIRRPSRAGDYNATAQGLRDLVGTLAETIAAKLPPPQSAPAK